MDRERDAASGTGEDDRSGPRSVVATLDTSRLKRVGVVTYFSVYAAIALGGWSRYLDLLRWLPLFHARGLAPIHVMLGLPRSVAWGLVSLTVSLAAVGAVAAYSLRRADADPPALGDGSQESSVGGSGRLGGLAGRVVSARRRLGRRVARGVATVRRRLGRPADSTEPREDHAGNQEERESAAADTDEEETAAHEDDGRETTRGEEGTGPDDGSDGDGHGGGDGDGSDRETGEAGTDGHEASGSLTNDGGRNVDLALGTPPVRRVDAPLTLVLERGGDDAEILDGPDPADSEDVGDAEDSTGSVGSTATADTTGTAETDESRTGRAAEPPAEDAAWPEEPAREEESGEAPDEAAPWPEEDSPDEATHDGASADGESFDEEAPWPEDWIAGDSI